jgi:hypothetical protein
MHSLATLVIARHPFPKTVFKEKKLSEPVEVRLLAGAKVMVRPKTKVKAYLVSEENAVRLLIPSVSFWIVSFICGAAS